jgi:hypothetical protein
MLAWQAAPAPVPETADPVPNDLEASDPVPIEVEAQACPQETMRASVGEEQGEEETEVVEMEDDGGDTPGGLAPQTPPADGLDPPTEEPLPPAAVEAEGSNAEPMLPVLDDPMIPVVTDPVVVDDMLPFVPEPVFPVVEEGPGGPDA